MPENKGFSEVEHRALVLLASGWVLMNAQGPVRANSMLVHGTERILLGRSTMARLRDLGLIRYVAGSAATAMITDRGRRTAAVLGALRANPAPA